ncbi:fas apoptotic inhibitory molecule 1-like [Liolophura sinensis]|uniref:fas apoptotic inhibitory molecule 1-like n=1 Tax=Liolophura sinensis TaxID=3198878 RepID=UPI0031590B04
MSVILTACRNSSRKALERARKRKAEKRRRLKEAEVAALADSIGPLPPQTATTRVWTFMLEDQPYGVVFNIDSMNVTLNGIRIECRADFTDDGSVTDFVVGDHKARITTTSSGSRRDGMIHCLSVDGYPIPE